MSINFSRNRTQVKFEEFIGVRNPQDLPQHKSDFKNYILSKDDALLLAETLKEDAKDFYYNGLISFAEGIDAVFCKRFSWATVKLYYSVFYLLRATLAIHNIAVLRCSSLYKLKIKTGEQAHAMSNRKYNSTHGGTIKYYEDTVGPADKMLTNTIDGQSVYNWLMYAREIVNYRSSAFAEPDCLSIWDNFASLGNDELARTLKELEDDDYIKCFQEEYAVLAIPIKLLFQTTKKFQDSGLLEQTQQNDDRVKVIHSIIKYKERNLEICQDLFKL